MNGVVYWNHGKRCLARLLTSLFSLRRHYSGPVTVMNEGRPPPWARRGLEELGAKISILPEGNEYGLVKKSRVWAQSPYDNTLFLDSDTVVLADPTPLLVLCEQGPGLVVTAFCGWSTSGRRISARIEPWTAVDRAATRRALRYGEAINTGVMAWRRGNPAMEDYQRLTERGMQARMGRKTLDEIAMQLAITRHTHDLAAQEWNCSCVYGTLPQAKIVHYHGHKHCRQTPAGRVWADHARATHGALGQDFEQAIQEDPSARQWWEDERNPDCIRDVTVVTVVTPRYAEKLQRNLADWLATPGLKDQRFLVFVNGFSRKRDRAFLNRPRVKVVRWDYPEASARETAMAAFIHGVAQHVTTAYWAKLDADCHVHVPELKWPPYDRYTVVSHRWGYTKMKGDPGATEHWFSKLDRLLSPGNPVLGARDWDPVADFKVVHESAGIPPRFASFFHIEKTEFTQAMSHDLLEKCGQRLPIPSHDTLSWYYCAKWGERVRRVNMKRQVTP